MRLALDTAYSACSVAVSDPGGKVLAAIHKEQRRGQAETLAPMVEEALKKAALKPADISEIILITGPGTFAGVRIATAFARAFALATGARVAGFSSFEALAVTAKAPDGGLVLALVPGKRGEISAQLFGFEAATMKPLKAPETLAVGDLKTYTGNKEVVAAGPDLETWLGGAPDLTISEKLSFWPKATDLLVLFERFGKGRLAETVSPFYLRPPDAKPQKPGPFSGR